MTIRFSSGSTTGYLNRFGQCIEVTSRLRKRIKSLPKATIVLDAIGELNFEIGEPHGQFSQRLPLMALQQDGHTLL